jgi:hypothetical protein
MVEAGAVMPLRPAHLTERPWALADASKGAVARCQSSASRTAVDKVISARL